MREGGGGEGGKGRWRPAFLSGWRNCVLRRQAEARRPSALPSSAVDALCNFELSFCPLGLSFPKMDVLSSCFIHYHHQNLTPLCTGLNSVMGPPEKDTSGLGFN